MEGSPSPSVFLGQKDAGRRCRNTYDPLTRDQLIKELTHG